MMMEKISEFFWIATNSRAYPIALARVQLCCVLKSILAGIGPMFQ